MDWTMIDDIIHVHNLEYQISRIFYDMLKLCSILSLYTNPHNLKL